MWSLFQDMPQARPCGLGLDFLSRTVLKQGPHPLGSVGKLKTVVSNRQVRHTTEAGAAVCQNLFPCDHPRSRGCEVPYFRTVMFRMNGRPRAQEAQERLLSN